MMAVRELADRRLQRLQDTSSARRARRALLGRAVQKRLSSAAAPPGLPPREAVTGCRGQTPGLPPAGRPSPPLAGAAVVLERLTDRGAGVLRAASRPASRLVQRPEPTDATSTMRLVVDHAVRPSRLRSSTAWRVRRPSPWPRGRSREPRRPAGGWLGMDSASRPSSRCGRSFSTATPATSPPSKGTDQIRAEIHCKGLGGDPGAGAGDGRAPSTTGERGYRVDGEVLRRLIREAGGGVRVRDLAGRTGTATAMRGGLVVVTYPGRRGAAGSGMAHVGSHADAAYGPRGWPVRRFPGLGRCPWNVDVALPALIVDAGPDAVARFLEFFAGRIANARTRAAYGRAVGQFLAWCEARGLGGGSGSTRRAGSGTTFRLTIGRRRPSTPTSRRPRSRSRRRRSSRAWPRRGGS